MPESPQTEIPTRVEIERLPRWARVAFAARCARRVQPLFKHFWPEAPAEHVEAVDRAITLAQAMAENAFSEADAEAVYAADSSRAHNAIRAAKAAEGDLYALAAAYAAEASHSSLNACFVTEPSPWVRVAAFAAASAATAATDATDKATRVAAAHAARAAIRRDFELLRVASKQEKWTEDTPVPPEFFGPMWPDGEPEGWPADEKTIPRPFNLVIDPGDADQETIQEVMSALSDLHEVHTGYALTYRVDGALILVEAEVAI